jgi:hypothetical protein
MSVTGAPVNRAYLLANIRTLMRLIRAMPDAQQRDATLSEARSTLRQRQYAHRVAEGGHDQVAAYAKELAAKVLMAPPVQQDR